MFLNNFFQTGVENQLPSLSMEIYILPKKVTEAADMYGFGAISLSQLAEVVEEENLTFNEEQKLMKTAMEYAAFISAKYDSQYEN